MGQHKLFEVLSRVNKTIFYLVVGVIVTTLLIINPLANAFLRSKLNTTIEGKFEIRTSHLKVNVFTGNLLIQDMAIHRFQKKEKGDSVRLFDFKVEKIVIEDVGVFSYIFSKRIKCDSIALFRPRIEMYQNAIDTTKGGFKPILYKGLALRKFSIVDGYFSQLEKKGGNQLTVVNDLDFLLLNFSLPKDSTVSIKNFKFDNIELTSSKIIYSKRKALYSFGVDSVYISTARRYCKFQGVKIMPNHSKDRFGKVVGKETTRIEGRIVNISIHNVDLETFLQKNILLVGKVYVNKFAVSMFKDKRLPRPVDNPEVPLPQDLINSIKLPFRVDSIVCTTGLLSFESLLPGADRSGSLYIAKANFTLDNITNIPSETAKDLNVSISGMLMGEGKMDARISFPLQDSNKPISYSGQILRMDLTKLNSFLQPTAFLGIKSGKLASLNFNAEANEKKATGELRIHYKDLNISVQKFRNRQIVENSNYEWLLNMLVNSLLIKKDNPTRKNELRVGTIDFERDNTRPVTHYIIQSILSGVPESLGIPLKIRKKHMDKKKEGFSHKGSK